MQDEYEDYEGEFDLEAAGYQEDIEEDDQFEDTYDQIFSDDEEVDADVKSLEYERDAVTGRKAKRPKLSTLNKSRLSKRELDDLFLQQP